jgi:hypothetical protein
MAFLKTMDVQPLDPNLFTGPSRQMSGVARTLSPTSDTQYGEFMRWMYVGTSGNVSYVKWDGTTQVLVSLAAGVWHPIHSIMINAVGTSATGIVVGS